MLFDFWLGGITASLLLVYLVYSILFPERL